MNIQELLQLPPEQRCADCQLYRPDKDGRCSACLRYQKRTGERRKPWITGNEFQGTLLPPNREDN